jgi:UDP-N-acetylmuramoylalanine--D-glutamate ligase
VPERVLILGLARQGVALARYLAERGARVVASDQRPAEELAPAVEALPGLGVELVLGGHPLSLLDGVDLVCLSGGVPPDLPVVREARRRGIPLSNDSHIFMQRCPPGVTVIGITGSAGKTTTTTLLGRMLQAQPQAEPAAAAGRTWVGGNIGNPLIADLDRMQPGDRAVMELSSFQLELMTLGPHIAAVLNLTPNHLDRHGSMAAYTAAKSNILRYQPPGGVAVLSADDPGARGLAPLARGPLAWFSRQAPVEQGAFLRGDRLMLRWQGRQQAVAGLEDVALRGDHNLLNVLAAIALAGAAGAPPEAMRLGLRGFNGVPHRLEFVAERGGARWYNDSIASAPERVLAALRAFDEPLVLLLGGRDKRLPWAPLAQQVRQRARHSLVFGEAAPLIERALAEAGLPPERFTRCDNLAQAVAAAGRVARPGDVVLLSPGCTSFDEFRDFEERGEAFRRLVTGNP